MDTRQRLLHAAGQVIRRDGVRAMTLAAVAREAGVSKGGLLYHFHSKRELIEAMADARREEVAAAVAAHLAAHPGHGLGQAYVALDALPITALDTALLAAAVEEPELLAPAREAFAALHQQLTSDATDPVLATVVRLACDGLWLTRMLGLDVLAAGEHTAVTDRLHRLASEATGSAPDRVR